VPALPVLSSWLKGAYRRDKESLRVVAIGLLTYVVPEAASRLSSRWFPELAESAPFADSATFKEPYYVLRRKFWRGFFATVAVAILALGTLALAGHQVRTAQSWLRIVAAVIAATATLARGGWEIQSVKGRTVVERIDRGMYRIGQLSAFALLVLIFGW
jgi:hypothetical protein